MTKAFSSDLVISYFVRSYCSISYLSINILKVFHWVVSLLFIACLNVYFTFDAKAETEKMSTGKKTDNTRLGQVIKKSKLLKQPNYQSDIITLINVDEKIKINHRKSAWYFISTGTIPSTAGLSAHFSVKDSGWVSMLNVRFVSATKRVGELGVDSLISSVSNDSLPTVSAGVRGFDVDDLKRSQANFKQLALLQTYAVPTKTAVDFAQLASLKVPNIRVKGGK